MIELTLIVTIVGAIWFFNRGVRLPSLPGGSAQLQGNKVRIRPLLIFGAVVVASYTIFFTNLPVMLIERDWSNTSWYWLLAPFSVLVLWKLFISKSSSSGGGLLDGVSKIINSFGFVILVCVVGGGALLILVAVLSLIFAFLHIWGIVDKNGLPLFLSEISVDYTTYLVSFLSPFVL
jgi:hypothetical protein